MNDNRQWVSQQCDAVEIYREQIPRTPVVKLHIISDPLSPARLVSLMGKGNGN
jgi:hypothetical protein